MTEHQCISGERITAIETRVQTLYQDREDQHATVKEIFKDIKGIKEDINKEFKSVRDDMNSITLLMFKRPSWVTTTIIAILLAVIGWLFPK